MLHNICMSAVAMSLRWANHGPWAYCFLFGLSLFCLGCSKTGEGYEVPVPNPKSRTETIISKLILVIGIQIHVHVYD